MWGDGGLEVQHAASSPVLWIIAAGVILVSALVLFGIYQHNRLAMILAAILSVIAVITTLFTDVKLIVATGVILIILIAVMVLVGVFLRRPLPVFSAIAPLIIGTVALFSGMILSGLYGYSYQWAYVIDTPLNQLAVAIVPIAGLIIGAVNVRKKIVTRWVTVPVFIFNFLVAFIVAFALYISIF